MNFVLSVGCVDTEAITSEHRCENLIASGVSYVSNGDYRQITANNNMLGDSYVLSNVSIAACCQAN